MTTCSELARTLGEPLAGTAPWAMAWIAIEQAGPWGARALTDSHFDPELGAALNARVEGIPLTLLLIRQPGRHADDHRTHGTRSVFIAYTGPEDPWLLHLLVDDPEVLLGLDLAAIARGVRPAVGVVETEPLVLVCTNSKRDLCCALLGRPVAAELEAERPGRVWESTHTGGHRLAPTILTLPDGYVFGGASAGSLTVAAARGRASLGRPEQSAELAALGAWGLPRPRALDVEPAESGYRVTDPLDGRTVFVEVAELLLDPPRKESCLKGPVSGRSFVASIVGPAE